MKIPKITAISDEFDKDLEKVLVYLKSRNLKYIELRDVEINNKVEKKRIGKFSEKELRYVKELLNKYDFKVSALGSPLFNHGFPKNDEEKEEMLSVLRRYVDIADFLDTKYIRVFSFKINPKNLTRDFTIDSEYTQQLSQVITLLKEATKIAATKDKCIMLENEPNLFGESVDSMLNLMNKLNLDSEISPLLKKSIGLLLDPGNMYKSKIDDSSESIKKILPLTVYSHIKDVEKTFFGSRKYCINGSKKSLIPYTQIFSDMLNEDYNSFFSVETHLKGDKWNNSISCLDGLIELLGEAMWDISIYKK